MGFKLNDLIKIQNREIFFFSTGGVFLVYAGASDAISATIMKTFEVAVGLFQIGMAWPMLSGLIIAAGAPGLALVQQKNRGNKGVRNERSRWEIIRDMLTVLTEDKKSKKTRIMQRACLDWRNFQRYFSFLLEEGFVTKCDNPELESYELTENGKELLKRLKVVGEMLH